MGVGSSDAAFDLIDYPYWRNDNSDTPAGQDFDAQPVPGCTIARVDDLGMRWEIRKSGLFLGDLYVELRMAIDVAHAGNSKDRLISFMNTVDAIHEEAFARANATDGDGVHAIELNEPIMEQITPQETTADQESAPDGKAILICGHVFEVAS